MTSDIVTRLLEHREDEMMLGNDWLVSVLGEAADEIERLRAENDALRVAGHQAMLVCPCTTNTACRDATFRWWKRSSRRPAVTAETNTKGEQPMINEESTISPPVCWCGAETTPRLLNVSSFTKTQWILTFNCNANAFHRYQQDSDNDR